MTDSLGDKGLGEEKTTSHDLTPNCGLCGE